MDTEDSTREKLSVGATLSRARQAAGMSINDVSQHIKLTAKQIEILESDGFDQLGLVFSRGFVRNYARLLGLDANELVQAIPNNARNKSDPISIHDEHIPLTKGLTRHWLIIVAIILGLLVVVPLLVYHWLSGDDTHIKSPLIGAALPSKHGTATQFVVQPAESPVPAATGAAAAVPPAGSPAAPALTPAASAVAVTAEPQVKTTAAMLTLQFDQDSWIEIRDAKKHIILSHLYHGGETAKLTETPPLSLTIGNAAHVKLSYNDKAIDITPHPPATVTKITFP